MGPGWERKASTSRASESTVLLLVPSLACSILKHFIPLSWLQTTQHSTQFIVYVHAGVFLNSQRESIPLLSTVVMFNLLLNPFLELVSAEPMCRMQSSHDKFLTLVWCSHSSSNIRLAYTDALLLHWGVVSMHGCYGKQNNVPLAIPQNIHSQLQDQRFVNLTPARVILDLGISTERRTPLKECRNSVGHFLD